MQVRITISVYATAAGFQLSGDAMVKITASINGHLDYKYKWMHVKVIDVSFYLAWPVGHFIDHVDTF